VAIHELEVPTGPWETQYNIVRPGLSIVSTWIDQSKPPVSGPAAAME